MKNTDKKPDKGLAFKPHQNEYLAKKRRERNKTFFTKKNIYRLILMSVMMCGAFVIWAEQTGFEGESLFITALGFFMMFAGIIALALVGALLLLLIRKLRGKPHSSFLDHEISPDEDGDDQGES